MSRWWIGPYWTSAGGARKEHDEWTRTERSTEIRVTNPSNREGAVDIVFFERFGGVGFHSRRVDWAGGTWTVPPGYQFLHSPRPHGRQFWRREGWFEIWTSRNDTLIDARLFETEQVRDFSSSSDSTIVLGTSDRALALWRNSSLLRRLPTLGSLGDAMLSAFGGTVHSRLYEPGRIPDSVPAIASEPDLRPLGEDEQPTEARPNR